MHTTGRAYRHHEPIEGNFDAIVIGSGMGGMSAAVCLARQGQAILLLEQHNVIGGLTQNYTRRGYRWSTGLHYVGDVASRRTLTRQLFDYITDDGIEWAPMPEIFNRVIVGGKSYDVPAGAEKFAAAMKAYFPAEHAAIDQYMDLVKSVSRSSSAYFAQKALPQGELSDAFETLAEPFYTFSDRLTVDVLREITADEELIAVLCGNWGDYSLEPTRSSFAMHCMLNKHYMNGGSYPVGGGGALADAMVPIIENAGGCVVHSAEVDQIRVEDGKVLGVRLASGEEIDCGTVISNAGIQNTVQRLLPSEAQAAKRLNQDLANLEDTYAVVGLNIGFKASGHVMDFTPANIWAHPSRAFETNLAEHKADFSAAFPWVFITFPSMKDPSWDNHYPDKATVEMYAYTDYSHFEKWAGTRWMKRGDDYLAVKAEIETRLLEELFRYAPKARDHVDYVEVSTPLSYETFVKRERGGFMGVASTPERFRQKWLRATLPLEGLYLTGQDVTSDGIIGALMGGVLAASAVVEKDLLSEIKSDELEKRKMKV